MGAGASAGREERPGRGQRDAQSAQSRSAQERDSQGASTSGSAGPGRGGGLGTRRGGSEHEAEGVSERERSAVRNSVGFTPADWKHVRVDPRARASLPLKERVLKDCTVNVNIFWMRHAFSCANLLECAKLKWSGPISLRSKLTPDPQLSDAGVLQAEEAGRALFQSGFVPDLVLSSGMTRALETALLAFGPTSAYAAHKVGIYPVPYISEKRAPLVQLREVLPYYVLHDDDNKLKRTGVLQMSLAEECFPDSIVPVGINWRYIAEVGNEHPPSLTRFYKHILPVVVSDLLAESKPQAEEVNVVVVSHSNFMRESLRDCEGLPKKQKVRNVSVWREHAGQLREGRFITMRDMLKTKHRRRVECVYPGAERPALGTCLQPRSYARCLQKEEIERLVVKRHGSSGRENGPAAEDTAPSVVSVTAAAAPPPPQG